MSRIRLALSLVVMVVGFALIAASCTPPVDGGGGSTTTTTTPSGPTIVGSACTGNSGVTVVVDFTSLLDEVIVGCASGAQTTGFNALHAAGFATSSESGPGTICTISSLPSQGYPYCWLTGGNWSYWKAGAAGSAWTFSVAGAGSGPIPAGAVEGWSWAPSFNSTAPRVSTSSLPH